MKRLVTISAMVLSMLLVFTGCSTGSGKTTKDSEVVTGSEETKNYRIGFSMWEFGNSYFVSLRDGAQEKADELGIELIIADPNNDPAQQVADIENFITMEVDAIIVCAIDTSAVDGVIKEAIDKGIKVIAQSIEIENCDVFAATEEYDIGYVVGKGAGQWIQEKYGEAAIECALFCLDSNTSTILRGDGMRDGILEYAPNAQIVARQDANTAALGQSVADSLLQAYPKLQVIVCMNDATALGALSAVEGAKRGNDDFYIGGLDNTDEARAAIATGGAMRATLDNIPYKNGKIDIGLCVDLIEGKTVDSRYVIDVELVTYDDIVGK